MLIGVSCVASKQRQTEGSGSTWRRHPKLSHAFERLWEQKSQAAFRVCSRIEVAVHQVKFGPRIDRKSITSQKDYSMGPGRIGWVKKADDGPKCRPQAHQTASNPRRSSVAYGSKL